MEQVLTLPDTIHWSTLPKRILQVGLSIHQPIHKLAIPVLSQLRRHFGILFFNILQYCTFVLWFASILIMYVFGVCVLFLFAIVSPASTDHISNNVFNGAIFRSFEDENMPLFDKVTSVGYGFLDRSSELYNLVQSPACSRYMLCHLSSTLGDQEANGFIFKDLFRAISATLDNKAGTDGMTRSVNVGLLTGDCDEPIMSCPELAPYFKKVADTWSSYL